MAAEAATRRLGRIASQNAEGASHHVGETSNDPPRISPRAGVEAVGSGAICRTDNIVHSNVLRELPGVGGVVAYGRRRTEVTKHDKPKPLMALHENLSQDGAINGEYRHQVRPWLREWSNDVVFAACVRRFEDHTHFSVHCSQTAQDLHLDEMDKAFRADYAAAKLPEASHGPPKYGRRQARQLAASDLDLLTVF